MHRPPFINAPPLPRYINFAQHGDDDSFHGALWKWNWCKMMMWSVSCDTWRECAACSSVTKFLDGKNLEHRRKLYHFGPTAGFHNMLFKCAQTSRALTPLMQLLKQSTEPIYGVSEYLFTLGAKGISDKSGIRKQPQKYIQKDIQRT